MLKPLQEIEIDKFIFHVVHHGEDEPILMDETPINGFEPFFRNRIREVLSGNRFNFTPTSSFLEEIKEIESDESRFLQVSKKMALEFHKHQDGRVKAGVMILMKASVYGTQNYILIKYDHEDVITYIQKDNKATLQEITNSFTKHKEALQKSAIINTQDDVPFAIVVDKSERQHITEFFKNYLGLKRAYGEEMLTQKVLDAYIRTVKQHRSELPKNYTSDARKHYYDLVQRNDNFILEDFPKLIFGSHYIDTIDNTFKQEIKRQKIEGEEFRFFKGLKKPAKKQYRTEEGVIIQYPSEADDTVKITSKGDRTIITVTTTRLTEE